jgi:REP element-mobilizing transposase RayT
MNKSPLPNRQNVRLAGYDYRSDGYYFITIITHHRNCIFGKIVKEDGLDNYKMSLNQNGKMIKDAWKSLPVRFNNINLDAFIVMPNHLHGIIEIIKSDSNTPLSEIVRVFKSYTAVKYSKCNTSLDRSEKLWQTDYYEHIIRTEISLYHLRQYITDNPFNWDKDPERFSS